MTRIGSIGECKLIDWDVRASFYVSLALLKIKDASAEYIAQYSNSSTFKREIELHSLQHATPKKINLGPISDVKIALPQTEAEQSSIARALSDVDALLATLDQVIAKKRDLKQAAMQQLVTAKTRLPGFDDEWKVSRLCDLIQEIGDGATPATSNSHNFGGTINWAVIEDIRDEISSTASTLTEQGLKSCAAKLWPPGTLILSTGATIGEVGIARVPLATKQGICGLVVDNEKAIPEYLKYWFNLNKCLLLAKAQGSTIKEIRAPTLVQLELQIPSVTEQNAIVCILFDMDAELSVLEARRNKTHNIKQAMMQELLTGKTRLIAKEDTHV